MEKSTQRPITVARLRSKPTRDGRARRIGGTGVIVRGPGVRRTQGQSTIPRGPASSSACYGVPSKPVKAVKVTPLRRPAASSTPRPTTAAKFPFPPRAREPRRAAAASVFDVGAPGFSGLSPDSE